MPKPHRLLAATILATAATASSASAQTDIAKKAMEKAHVAWAKIQNSCNADAKSFCNTVTPGDGRMIFCMLAHEDKISDKCADTLLEVSDNIQLAVSNIARAAEACSQDIDKVCNGVEAGGGRVAQCLIDNQPKLSSPCRAEVAGFQARMK